jgi:glutathione synthase/RimK-type ligase-like ATP-grasp enzyme
VPETLLTNDPGEICTFFENLDGGVVFKPFTTLEGAMGGTQMMKGKYLGNLSLLRNAPAIFQKVIPPGHDIRVTVIGKRIFAAESRSEYLDWRVDGNLIWTRHELPDSVEQGIRRLMSFLGLSLGSLDFRVDADGQYNFLEINPNGQFLFLEIDDARLRITSALAKLLVDTSSFGCSEAP